MRVVKFSLVVLMALPMMGQTAATPEDAHKAGAAVSSILSSVIGPVFDVLMQPTVTGEPYTATSVKREEQKLADGTVITKHGRHHVLARDTEGRIRVEHTMLNATATTPAVKMVYVKDPVAGTMTMWTEGGKETAKKTAEVIKLPDMKKDAPKPATANAKAPKKPNENTTTEQLGQQSMEGVLVTGVRTTTVIPVGAAGNDRPITRTKEVWTAPDLQLTVREVSTDPRTGTTTIELEDLSRENPPMTTFQPPVGYTVQNLEDVMKQAQAQAKATAAQPQP